MLMPNVSIILMKNKKASDQKDREQEIKNLVLTEMPIPINLEDIKALKLLNDLKMLNGVKTYLSGKQSMMAIGRKMGLTIKRLKKERL